jgi:S-adenosylmethionine decarboxylase
MHPASETPPAVPTDAGTAGVRVPGPEADAGEMCSYALDVWMSDVAILTDADRLVEIMRTAARAGHAVVLGEARHTFPNGAVTAVLVLSQSHLSVHTWPEHGSANFDLLTCGRLNGELMIGHLEATLRPDRTALSRTDRDIR